VMWHLPFACVLRNRKEPGTQEPGGPERRNPQPLGTGRNEEPGGPERRNPQPLGTGRNQEPRNPEPRTPRTPDTELSTFFTSSTLNLNFNITTFLDVKLYLPTIMRSCIFLETHRLVFKRTFIGHLSLR
jgi:hypothetical protein